MLPNVMCYAKYAFNIDKRGIHLEYGAKYVKYGKVVIFHLVRYYTYNDGRHIYPRCFLPLVLLPLWATAILKESNLFSFIVNAKYSSIELL